MITLLLFLFFEPEDSNNLYLIDRIFTVREEQFMVGYDSLSSGLYTNQGCLDLLNWYIELDLKHDVWLASWLGVRYRYNKLGDYGRQMDDHRFEPTFKIGKNRLHLMIVPKYYKGGDEIGIGFSTGDDYLNYLQFFFSIPDFDRNYSLRFTPDTLPKYLYRRFPLKFSLQCRRRWDCGYLKFIIQRTLPSFQVWDGHETIKSEQTRFSIYITNWFRRFNLGFAGNYNENNSKRYDMIGARSFFGDSLSWFEIQPWVGVKINSKFSAYFHYRIDIKRHFKDDFDYHRSGNGQYLDIHYRMSDDYLWHFGYQGEYVKSGMLRITCNHRFIVGLQYSFKKGKFVLWEGIEADRPFRIARLHNHTYLSFLFSF